MKKFSLIILLLIVASCHSQDKDKKENNLKDSLKSVEIETPINNRKIQYRKLL